MQRTVAFTDWHEIKIHKIKHIARLVMTGGKTYLVIKSKNIKVFCVDSHSPIELNTKNEISISHARKLGIL